MIQRRVAGANGLRTGYSRLRRGVYPLIQTTITTITPSALAKATVTYTPHVPVAIATKETQTPAPAPATAPVEEMPLTLIVIGIAGAIAVIAGAFVVRRWWIRRQNPALFEDTPFFR